jgi:hypothetical protein
VSESELVDSELEDVSSEELSELVSDDDDDDDTVGLPLSIRPGALKIKPFTPTPPTAARPSVAPLAPVNGRCLFRGASSKVAIVRLGRCVR